VPDQQNRSDHKQAVGNIEVRPSPSIVPLKEYPIADGVDRGPRYVLSDHSRGPAKAMETEAIIEVSENTCSDTPERNGEPPILCLSEDEKPVENPKHSENREKCEPEDQPLSDAENSTLVQTYLQADVTLPKPEKSRFVRGGWPESRKNPMLGAQVASDTHNNKKQKNQIAAGGNQLGISPHQCE